MPDSATINYSFTLPEIGGSNDSWGTKLNDNSVALDALLKTKFDLLAATKATADAALPSASYSAADVLSKLLTVDGAASGLDADTVDGLQASAFLQTSAYTAADVMAKVQSLDGAGSGLDADLLDGQNSTYFTDIAGRLGYTPLSTGGGTITGSLTVTGDITSSSDARLKRDIKHLDGAEMLAALRLIGGQRYLMRDEPKIGVIAQAVLAAGLPELVTKADNNFLAVSYGNLVAVLIAALVHLADRVEALERGHDAA